MMKIFLHNMLLLCFFGLVPTVILWPIVCAGAEQATSSNLGQKRGVVSGGIDTEYPDWFNHGFLDFKEDLATANHAGKRLMILFVLNGCPYCHAFVERNLSQKEVETLLRNKFDVITINMMGDRNVTHVDGKTYTEKTFAEALKIQFTPTAIFLNEKGETILRLNGYLPPEQFKVALDYLVEKSGKLSFRDYLELNAQTTKPGKLNHEDFYIAQPYNLMRKTQAKSKPLAVFFEQKDCPNCDVLHQKILSQSETRKLLKQFDVVQLDMWDKTPLTTPEGKKSTAREWAKLLDVKYAPTIILFGDDGKEVIRTEAFFKLFHVQTVFDYVASGSYKQQPSFQRYIHQRSEQERAQGRDVNIWSMGDDSKIQLNH